MALRLWNHWFPAILVTGSIGFALIVSMKPVRQNRFGRDEVCGAFGLVFEHVVRQIAARINERRHFAGIS